MCPTRGAGGYIIWMYVLQVMIPPIHLFKTTPSELIDYRLFTCVIVYPTFRVAESPNPHACLYVVLLLVVQI